MEGAREFRLPDAGEGLTEAEIVVWRVAPGDRVDVNDIVVEIETAKAVVELPSPYSGTVAALLVQVGETVPVGTPIMTVAEEVAADEPADAPPSPPDSPAGLVDDVPLNGDGVAPRPAADTAGAAADGSGPNLVGYGVGRSTATTAARRRRYHRATSRPAAGWPVADVPAGATASGSSGRVLAKPPVRRLARDLGVDLAGVAGTGPGGLVTRSDVLDRTPAGPGETSTGPAAVTRPAAPSGAAEPGDVRVPVRGVRRATAEAMVQSAFTAPHVTEWVQVDVTKTMEFVRSIRDDRDFAGSRVSPLLVAAKAACLAARRNPGVNATWDGANQEIVLRERVNLGIAAATARGLVVPVVRGADRLRLPQLAQELTDIVATARDGRLQPHQMTGGTLTITNIGVFGVDGGTPILPPGQAAILTIGQIRPMPWVVDGEVVARQVTTLSVSFDHRLVDGELGSAFLTDVTAVLEDPARGLLWC